MHLTVTVLVVVVTANHYWLDGVVALILLTAAILILPGPATAEPGRKAPADQDAVLHLPHGER